MAHAVITMHTKQTAQGETDEYEMRANGTYEEQADGTFTLCYEECSDELADCITTLLVEQDCVKMTRKGTYETTMVIARGQRHLCPYQSPYGLLELGIYAKEVAVHQGKTLGSLKLVYNLDCNAELLSENELQITYKVVD